MRQIFLAEAYRFFCCCFTSCESLEALPSVGGAARVALPVRVRRRCVPTATMLPCRLGNQDNRRLLQARTFLGGIRGSKREKAPRLIISSELRMSLRWGVLGGEQRNLMPRSANMRKKKFCRPPKFPCAIPAGALDSYSFAGRFANARCGGAWQILIHLWLPYEIKIGETRVLRMYYYLSLGE